MCVSDSHAESVPSVEEKCVSVILMLTLSLLWRKNTFKQLKHAAGLHMCTLNRSACQMQVIQRLTEDVNDPVLNIVFMRT